MPSATAAGPKKNGLAPSSLPEAVSLYRELIGISRATSTQLGAAEAISSAISPFFGQAQRQAAADGGFASRANLSQAKAHGVRDMAFKKCGLRIEDMVKSRWVYRKLRNFRRASRPASPA